MSRIDDFEEMLDSYEGREFVSPFSFNGLVWQPKAYREPGKTDKAELFFDDSQKELVKAGYERHPFSAEAYGLIIAHLEGKLPPELDEIAEDMLADSGEFFCQAIETIQISDRSIVRIYEHVTALPRNANKGYDRSGMKYSGTPNIFDVSDLEFVKYYYFKNISGEHDCLIEYLTSRNFSMLPGEIKDNGGIGLPGPGEVWPLGRVFVGFDAGFSNEGASRGVRPAKVKTR